MIGVLASSLALFSAIEALSTISLTLPASFSARYTPQVLFTITESAKPEILISMLEI